MAGLESSASKPSSASKLASEIELRPVAALDRNKCRFSQHDSDVEVMDELRFIDNLLSHVSHQGIGNV